MKALLKTLRKMIRRLFRLKRLIWLVTLILGALSTVVGVLLFVAIGLAVWTLITSAVDRRLPARDGMPERTVPWQASVDAYMDSEDSTATLDFVLGMEEWRP